MESVDKKVWAPSGAFTIKNFQLSPEQKSYIVDAAGIKHHESKERFLQLLNIWIGGYKADVEFFSITAPARIKSRMNKLKSLSEAFMKEINGLDPYSVDLFSRSGRSPDWLRSAIREVDGVLHVGAMPDGAPITETCKGFTFSEASAAVAAIWTHAEWVLNYIKGFKTNQRPQDFAKRNLAKYLGYSMRDILGINLTPSENGPFSNTLRAVLDCVGSKTKKGVDKGSRDVRQLIKNALGDIDSQTENWIKQFIDYATQKSSR